VSDEMTDFEKQMAKTLRRVDAPEGFAERVMQRAEAESAHVVKVRFDEPKWWELRSWRWMTSPWAGGAVAALLVASVFLTGAHVHEEHVKQAQATQQFETATQITDRALAHARETMKRAGVNADQ
jgi:hypothetical protein